MKFWGLNGTVPFHMAICNAKILHLHGKKNASTDLFGANLWWASLFWALQDGCITEDQIAFWAEKDKRTNRYLKAGEFETVKKEIDQYADFRR